MKSSRLLLPVLLLATLAVSQASTVRYRDSVHTGERINNTRIIFIDFYYSYIYIIQCFTIIIEIYIIRFYTESLEAFIKTPRNYNKK